MFTRTHYHAINDGRITVDGKGFDYCGHKFEKLLYLYPEYSKPEVAAFLENAVDCGCDVKVLGEYTHDFEGKPAKLIFGAEYFLSEDSDIPAEMKLTPNNVENGCVLEDGSVVISDYDSVMNHDFCTYTFEASQRKYEACFRGTLALKADENGNPVRLTAGNLKYIKKDGEEIISASGDEDYIMI